MRKWKPVGPDEVVTMDKDQPFVGDQSPRIALDASTAHGIVQSGIPLVNGKQYNGRIWLRGTPGAKVNVTLSWGSGANDKQTIAITPLTAQYKKFPLSFTAKADTADGAIEISGTGTGNIHIGTLSLMPSDNVEGFRPDTIALLKDLHAGMWRLPGGNFISDWVWYDSIGDIDKTASGIRRCVARHADQRPGHGRADDALQAHRRRSIHHRQCGLWRFALRSAGS